MKKQDSASQTEFSSLPVVQEDKYSHELMEYADSVRELGMEAGSQNLPGSLWRSPDANETELRYHVEKQLKACQFYYEGKLRAHIDAAEKLEAELKDRTYTITLSRRTSQAKAIVPNLLESSRSTLLDLRKEERAHEIALGSFKETHERHEPPVFPISQRAHFMMLGAIAMVEAFFNIAFYGEFRGIVTAGLIALGASMANVAVSAYVGTLWRFKNSVTARERRLGWFYFALWASYIFYLNKFIAAFRTSLERVPVDAADAIGRASLLGSELTFSYPWDGMAQLDITSWFLLIFGVIVAVAALLKGYHADDPYPQYGIRVRLYAQARAKYLGAERALCQTADEYLSEAEEALLAIADEKRATYALFNETAQAIQKVFSDYKIDTDAIVEDYVHLTEIYRTANRAARTTTVPLFFAHRPKIAVADLRVPLRWQRRTLEKQKAKASQAWRDAQMACAKARKQASDVTRMNRNLIRSYLENVDEEREAA